jgi:AcrR family transcriptional regulator
VVSQHRNAAIPDERILDAAYDLVLAVGVRRLNMAEVARAAGVSRATLYRRFANVDAVVAALTTRELARLAHQAFARPGRDVRSTVVGAVVAMVQAVRTHPLTRKIIDVDPDFLLPYLVRRRGTSTDAQLELLVRALRNTDGSIRHGNRIVQARTVWLTAWSFALTGPVLTDDAVSIGVLDSQLRHLLDRYLAP